MNIIGKAAMFASAKHKGQVDDDGKPYILHPSLVADIIVQLNLHDDNLLAAAYLHDVIEDTNTTYTELLKEFGKDIADLVHEVTHEGTKETGYYFPRLKTQRGIVLKFADRLHNLSRMSNWDEKRRSQYLRKSKFWKSEI